MVLVRGSVELGQQGSRDITGAGAGEIGLERELELELGIEVCGWSWRD